MTCCIGWKRESIRYIGINTPETHHATKWRPMVRRQRRPGVDCGRGISHPHQVHHFHLFRLSQDFPLRHVLSGEVVVSGRARAAWGSVVLTSFEKPLSLAKMS